MWWLLVGCALEGQGDSAQEFVSQDVDVTPRHVDAAFDRTEFDCTSNDLTLHDFSETADSIVIWNYESEAVRLATKPQTPDTDHSWVTVTWAEELGEPIWPDTSTTVELTAIGHCANGETIQGGDHLFELYVAIDEVHYDITATVTVESVD